MLSDGTCLQAVNVVPAALPWELTELIATATLLGSALLTLLVGLSASQAPTRTLLIGASLLMTLTGVAFAVVSDFWPLVVIAFVGTLNPSSGDVSVFMPLEQAELARVISNRDRTRLFARYSFIGSVMAAVGALAAGLPEGAAKFFGADTKLALQGAFLFYAGLGRLATSNFGWPLIIAGGLKIAYDLLLLMLFRKKQPPEELEPFA